MAAKDAQHFMCGAMVVVIPKHPVAPCGRPVIGCKQRLKPGCWVLIRQRHRLAIDDERQLCVVRKHAIIGEGLYNAFRVHRQSLYVCVMSMAYLLLNGSYRSAGKISMVPTWVHTRTCCLCYDASRHLCQP